MRLAKNYLLVAFSMVLVTDLWVSTAAAKNRPLRECTDPDYDMADCERALRVQQRKKDQEKLSDNERQLLAGLGEDVLVEKATDYRAGVHKIQIVKPRDTVTGVRFGAPDDWKTFVLGDVAGCDISNFIEILKNTRDFTYFRWTCEFTWPTNRRRDTNIHYLNYDKRHNRLDELFSAHGYNSKSGPSFTFTNGVYKFSWKDHVAEKGLQADNIYYDFKITGNRPQDLKCLKSWNGECDIALRAGPLKPNEYRIVDE